MLLNKGLLGISGTLELLELEDTGNIKV
jgi:hypothetical protein